MEGLKVLGVQGIFFLLSFVLFFITCRVSYQCADLYERTIRYAGQHSFDAEILQNTFEEQFIKNAPLN